MSQVIAVVQMDDYPDAASTENPDLTKSRLLKQFTLLSYCQNVSDWAVLTPPLAGGNILNELGNTALVSRLDECLPGEDSLDAFHRIVDRMKKDTRDDDQPVSVARLVPGLADPEPARIDAAVAEHLRNEYDYSSLHVVHAQDWTLELMQYETLQEAWQEALLPDDRAFITPYIFRQQLRLNLGSVCRQQALAS